MKRKVTFVHTSPAAIPPLMQFYGAEAPELEITNLLDDGILRSFAAGDVAAPEARFRDMLAVARSAYRAELAMITCSAVPRGLMQKLESTAGFPVLKIDDPMAAMAVRSGGKIGVVVTFEPTLEPTSKLLREAAERAGVSVALVPCVVAEAYRALLGGDPERHDRLMLEAIDKLAAGGVSAIVLAQVSMARLQPKLEGRYQVPVFSSLPSSLDAIRKRLTS
jgi:Asp/Glu/hydantoin racemase